MYKKHIKYVDYNGVEREEDFYFNLNKTEIMEMELGVVGGMTQMLHKIIAEQNTQKLAEIFKDMVLKSYGEKSADGKRFIKNQELRDSFVQTEAYSNFFWELATNADEAAAFINGIIPQTPGKITQIT